MKQWKWSLGIAALSLGLGAAVQARVLETAPAVLAPTSEMFCQIRNVSKGPRTVTIRALDGTGATSSSLGPVVLNPGQAVSHLATGFGVSCHFDVTGSLRNYRGVAAYFDGTIYRWAIVAR